MNGAAGRLRRSRLRTLDTTNGASLTASTTALAAFSDFSSGLAPSILWSLAMNSFFLAFSSASIDQYSFGLNFSISPCRSTSSRRATV